MDTDGGNAETGTRNAEREGAKCEQQRYEGKEKSGLNLLAVFMASGDSFRASCRPWPFCWVSSKVCLAFRSASQEPFLQVGYVPVMRHVCLLGDLRICVL